MYIYKHAQFTALGSKPVKTLKVNYITPWDITINQIQSPHTV